VRTVQLHHAGAQAPRHARLRSHNTYHHTPRHTIRLRSHNTSHHTPRSVPGRTGLPSCARCSAPGIALTAPQCPLQPKRPTPQTPTHAPTRYATHSPPQPHLAKQPLYGADRAHARQEYQHIAAGPAARPALAQRPLHRLRHASLQPVPLRAVGAAQVAHLRAYRRTRV
jgi:hypothetical protein